MTEQNITKGTKFEQGQDVYTVESILVFVVNEDGEKSYFSLGDLQSGLEEGRLKIIE